MRAHQLQYQLIGFEIALKIGQIGLVELGMEGHKKKGIEKSL